MLQNILNLEGVAVLSKEQQKNVNGGYRQPNVLAPLNPGGGGTCYLLLGRSGDGEPIGYAGISRADVDKYRAENGGGQWCCSSCSNASWLTPAPGGGYHLS